MARQYSTRDFFRKMPNALLARYFQGRGLFSDMDFAAMKEGRPDKLFEAWRFCRTKPATRLTRSFGTSSRCAARRALWLLPTKA